MNQLANIKSGNKDTFLVKKIDLRATLTNISLGNEIKILSRDARPSNVRTLASRLKSEGFMFKVSEGIGFVIVTRMK